MPSRAPSIALQRGRPNIRCFRRHRLSTSFEIDTIDERIIYRLVEDAPDDPVPAYLEAKGAVELLCEIEPDGSQFTRLVEESSVSRSTGSTRLREGEQLGLYKRREIEGRGTSHAYHLTETGAKLRLYLDHTGLTERHRTIKAVRRRFDEDVRKLTEWTRENEGELKPPVAEDGFRE